MISLPMPHPAEAPLPDRPSAPGPIHRILPEAPLLLHCVKGSLWLTQEGSREDFILAEGDRVELEAGRLALVEALAPGSSFLTRAVAPGRAHGRSARPGR